ncbi:MAG: signal peptidase I [Clostridium sp.]|nr:signal peptidase I [Clostridium sp.]
MSDIKEKEIIENQDKNESKTSKKSSFFKELVIDIAIVAVVAFSVWKFIGYGVWITSGSMIPTLEVKDRLIVTRVHNTDKLNYGDIVLFKNEEYGDDILIKRLIGKPGDKIEIKNGLVFRNGEQLDEPYVKNNEKYNGVFEVPEDEFFFLGDNRPNSADARYWKDPYVEEDNIEGKAIFRYYPFNAIGSVK